MNITLAGTSSGMAVARRAPSALFVEAGSDGVLIDAGDGTARQLVRLGLDYNRIRAVLITHMHPDHAAGLIGLFQLMHLSGRGEPVSVFVPDSVRSRMDGLLPVYQIFQEKWPFDIRFEGLKDGMDVAFFSFTLTAVRNGHLKKNASYARTHGLGTECYSLLFGETKGPRCLYTSDIDDFSHLEDRTGNVRMLIPECTHVTVEHGVRFAEKHGIPRTVFTHIPPDVDERILDYRSRYPEPPVRFAEDGDTIEIT